MSRFRISVASFLILFFLVTCQSHEPLSPPEEFLEIRVMTFNVLYTTSANSTFDVLNQTRADIIGLQESSKSRISELAQRLNYYSYSFSKTNANLSDQDTGILSRFPIVGTLRNGVIVQVNPKLKVAVFSVHLSPYPYQPYDLRDSIINTAEEAVSAASDERLPEINPVLDEIELMRKQGISVFLTGDFNEPSHLDWTQEAANNNLHFGKAVQWPVSKKIVDSGLIDVYRSKYADPTNFPCNTWTTQGSTNEVYDRIDIIYQTNEQAFNLSDIRMVGPDNPAGIIVDGYASDHFAVMATYQLKPL